MTKRTRRLRQPKAHSRQLDIIIPVYGRADLLEKCLASVEENTIGVEARVIVVDDCGPEQDELNTVYRSLNGTSRLVRHKQNFGYPRAINTGVSYSSAPLLLLLNTDVELQTGAIGAMLAEFDKSEVGIVGPKLLFPPNSTDPTRPPGKVQHAGLAVRFNGQITHTNIGWNADHPKVNERRVVQAITGACMMIRRETWQKVLKLYRDAGDNTSGAMNEVYSPGTYEDVEFCLAARSVGYETIYQPQAVGYHQVGASIIAAGGAYPLGRNEYIFRARCGQVIAWDEWKYA